MHGVVIRENRCSRPAKQVLAKAEGNQNKSSPLDDDAMAYLTREVPNLSRDELVLGASLAALTQPRRNGS